MRHTANHSLEAIATRDELRASTDICRDDWLHPRELAEFSRLRDARASEAWRFGRWLGKHLVLERLEGRSQPLATIAICSRNERRQSVRPAITIAEQIVPWSLSISHSERLVAALLITRPGITVGVDLASRQPFRPGFLRTWFFPSEQEWAQSGPSDIAAIIWAAKEAVYKAFNEGESFAPHMVEILERSWEGEAPAEPCLAGALSTAGLKSVVDCPPTLTLPREGGGGSTTDVALTFEAPESVGALDGSSGRLSARYRGRDVSSECQIEYRTLDNDVVVIARRCEASHCIEFSREPDGARDLVGENR